MAGGVAAVALAFAAPAICIVDGGSMFAVAYSMVHGSLAVPPQFGMIGRHGLYYSKWYPLLSVIAVPFAALGAAIGPHFGIPPRYAAQATSLLVPVLLFALNTYLTAVLSRQIGASPRGSLLAGIAFAFGTVALVYGREFFADPLLASLTAGGLCVAFGSDEAFARPIASGIAASAVLAKPTGIVLGPCLALYGFLRSESISVAVAPLLGTLAGLIIYIGYNLVRFGQPLTFGQPYAFGLSAVMDGTLGLLFSPGHGLVWYCPVVIAVLGVSLSVFKKVESLTLLATIGSYFLFYAAWKDWAGGWCWGPRMLMPILPPLMAFTGTLNHRWRTALAGLIVVGFIVNCPNLVGYYGRYYHEANAAGISETARNWSFRQGPLFGVWRSDVHQIRAALASRENTKDIIREAGAADRSSPFASPCLKVIPVWWWMLPAVGLPLGLGIAAACALVILGAAAIIGSFHDVDGLDSDSVLADKVHNDVGG